MSTNAKVNPIPDGYHSVTAYLTVDDAARAIEFYKAAFGAEELYRLPMGERIGHAEIRIGDTRLMLSDEFVDMNIRGPKARGGPTSPGLTSEEIVIYRATGLRRVGPGGGLESESITVHEVPLAGAEAWLREREAAGLRIDLKVYAGLYFARTAG